MAVYTIPLEPEPQSFTIALGGKLAVSGDVPPMLDNLGEDVTLLFEVDDDD